MNAGKLILTMAATASTALALVSCGGGGGGGDPASGGGNTNVSGVSGSPTVSGTVTGFGSVFVDGVRIDDRGTLPGMELDDDRITNIELKLGQSVDIQHDGVFKARRIRVQPEIKGLVSAVDAGAGTMTVLGMTVLINTNPAAGPTTVFEAPYTLASVRPGDGVEIHGILKTDAGGRTVLQATRIEKEDTLNTYTMRGPVSLLSAGAGTFKLGDMTFNYQNARILPTPGSIFNGADVIVSIPASASLSGGAVNASKVVVRDYREENRGQEAQLRGVVSNFSAAARTFTLNGFNIDASQAAFPQSGRSFADLSNGSYLRIKGVFRPDGSVLAQSISLRSLEIENDGEVELRGSIGDFVSNANFTLRGITVDGSSAPIRCAAGTTLQNNLQVKVEGMLTASGTVRAREIECEGIEDGISSVERKGVAGAVDAAARTFTLSGTTATSVRWSDATWFISPLTAGTLNGQRVEVEGVMSANVLVASKIKLDDN